MSIQQQIEARIRSFPNMPALCASLVTRLTDPNTDARVLTEALRYDPGMTANILRLANSAYYGAPSTISSLHDAIVRIGLNKLIQLLLARGLAGTLRAPLRGYDLRPEELLMHSAWTAVAAEELCRVIRIQLPATVFTAGLLHDIGKVILDEYVFAQQSQLDEIAAARKITHYEAETVLLGINHAEAGARLLEQWGFPKELVVAARWHHTPSQAPEFVEIANMIHIANTLAFAAGIGSGRAESVYTPAPTAIANLHLTRANLEFVASQTLDKMKLLHETLTC